MWFVSGQTCTITIKLSRFSTHHWSDEKLNRSDKGDSRLGVNVILLTSQDLSENSWIRKWNPPKPFCSTCFWLTVMCGTTWHLEITKEVWAEGQSVRFEHSASLVMDAQQLVMCKRGDNRSRESHRCFGMLITQIKLSVTQWSGQSRLSVLFWYLYWCLEILFFQQKLSRVSGVQ